MVVFGDSGASSSASVVSARTESGGGAGSAVAGNVEDHGNNFRLMYVRHFPTETGDGITEHSNHRNDDLLIRFI